MNNIINERKNIIKDILKMYCDSKGLTYIAKYIYDNNLINKINSVLDEVDMDSTFNKNSIIALAQIERVYINKYAFIDKTILNFLFYNQAPESIKSINFDEMLRGLESIDTISLEYFEKSVKRFKKLGLINISNEDCVRLINKYSVYAPFRKNKKKENVLLREERSIKYNSIRKINKYKLTINELYKLYCNGMSMQEVCEKLPFNAEIFYYDIQSYKNYFDKFAIKLANYNFELYLRNKYINCLIITNVNSIDLICEIIYMNNQKMPYSRLSKKIDNYLKLSPIKNNNLRQYLIALKDKYEPFYEKKSIENKEEAKQIQLEKMIMKYEKLICDFIESRELDVVKYCNNNDIKVRAFNKALSTLERSNNPIYRRYNLYTSEYINAKNDKYLNTFYIIMNYIRNGIEGTYSFREFDIIDYFEITSISPIELFNNVKNIIDSEDYICFLEFANKNPISNPLNDNEINSIYSSNHILNVKFDENGELIENSGRVVRLEEKEEAINELKELNIPINDTTYDCMLKRIINRNDKQLKLVINNKK